MLAIARREQASEVRLAWDGAPLRIENRGVRAVPVPALGQFELVSAEPVLEETRHVLLRFPKLGPENGPVQPVSRGYSA